MTAQRGIAAPLRLAATGLGLIALWQLVVTLSGVPPFLLPGPGAVAESLVTHAELLARNACITVLEMTLGLLLGTTLGAAAAIAVTFSPVAHRWTWPLMVASQALPVFAIAPLLVLWLGYGLASKVAMTTIVIFFPVASAFHDGLRRTDPGLLDLARTMGAGRWRTLAVLQVPAALPAFASGLRVAAAVAPIGAVIGEWVGSGAGLGYLMLHANSRMQTDVMFAALVVLAAIGLLLHAVVDRLARRLVPWQPERSPASP